MTAPQRSGGAGIGLSTLLARPKPRMGEACNGCGMCCVMEPCRLAVELVGAKNGPCPALEYADGRTYCGLVKRPAFYMFGEYLPEKKTGDIQAQFAYMLGIGMGCDADDDLSANAEINPRLRRPDGDSK